MAKCVVTDYGWSEARQATQIEILPASRFLAFLQKQRPSRIIKKLPPRLDEADIQVDSGDLLSLVENLCGIAERNEWQDWTNGNDVLCLLID